MKRSILCGSSIFWIPTLVWLDNRIKKTIERRGLSSSMSINDSIMNKTLRISNYSLEFFEDNKTESIIEAEQWHSCLRPTTSRTTAVYSLSSITWLRFSWVQDWTDCWAELEENDCLIKVCFAERSTVKRSSSYRMIIKWEEFIETKLRSSSKIRIGLLINQRRCW